MEFHVRTEDGLTTIEWVGPLDRSISPSQRDELIALVRPGCRLLIDFSRTTNVTGAGLRMLLLLSRAVRSVGGTIGGSGAAESLRDTAEAAGFTSLFRRDQAAVPQPFAPRPTIARIDGYPTHEHSGFGLRVGHALPLGATYFGRSVNFAVFSRHATSCTLVLFETGSAVPKAEIPFPSQFRIGDVFAMAVFDLDPESFEYGFRMDGPHDPKAGHRFDPTRVLLDPMARSIAGGEVWGRKSGPKETTNCRGRLLLEDFDWEGDTPLGLPFEDLTIYEMHVRGFTRSPSSGVKHPGTFAGILQKIPYLKELGVNCVELMPIFEFDEMEIDRKHPRTGEPLVNYWGYSTTGFFAPNSAYAATGEVGIQADEFKNLIKELHRNGIEIMLDVVFNHTAEGNENGPTLSFRGIDNKTYYMLTPDGFYLNFSGCGNTFNCNHPVVRDFVLSCLRHWVSDYHIDGFRFDLASILGRDETGAPLANPPLLESLALDPILGRTKLVAEAWDAGGLYQVGSFPAYGRWAEWNGKYRDCIRRFLKGEPGRIPELAQRLAGSPDLYAGRGAAASINFVTCHDGFTLADLVSYNDKHNEDNGEDNRDGSNDNWSWNCGAEGPTDDPAIRELRLRQTKNALTILFLSQGVPMILMGDELGRSQAGNNNAYCQDSPLVWLDWTLRETNADLFRFARRLVAFRQTHAALRQSRHADESEGAFEISFHGTEPWHPDWSDGSRQLAMMLRLTRNGEPAEVLFAAFNAFWEELRYCLPLPPNGWVWRRVVDTGRGSPDDIAETDDLAPAIEEETLAVGPRSAVVLAARPPVRPSP